MKRILLLLSICSSFALSDEIYFKSGAIIGNVIVTDTVKVEGGSIILVQGKNFIARHRLADVGWIK